MLIRKMNDAQQREMYPNLVITGIIEQPNENPIQVYNNFIQDQLEIQELIPIHRAYRVGSGQARPLIVELRDPITYKPKIYNRAGKLKNKVNSAGGRFFITDHLPEEYNETRRRVNDLIVENKKWSTAEQLNMTAKRGHLYIDEQLYEKAIRSPTPTDLMKPDEKLAQLADEIDMVRGKDNYTGKSKFIAYAAAVQDLQDVQAAYIKVCTKYAEATHVVTAYRVNGASATCQDYVDDGEFGAGRVILNILKEQKLMNAVIFMIRYHGGKNLGPVRFNIFKEVANSAIANLRKRAEEIKQQDQQEERERNKKHQEYLKQQRENPAFPETLPGDWSAPMENWEETNKKTK